MMKMDDKKNIKIKIKIGYGGGGGKLPKSRGDRLPLCFR